MAIQKLPEHIINKLKAWEIVERPSSVLKELMENSLDAGAKKIQVDLKDGWRNLIKIEDDGSGIELSDMDLLLERYATSKTKDEEDLYAITQYGFRGEALASISEVSKISVLSKTAYSQIGTKLVKRWQEIVMKHIPVPFEHGTIVMVEDLFFNVPARLKFLKSAQTEFYYCYNYFVDVALWHFDKHLVFKKNDKIIFDLEPTRTVVERINDVFKKDYSKNLHVFEEKQENIFLSGIVSDPSLRFGSGENIRIYVNKRPVNDKIIRRALMDAYQRQLHPGEFPFVVLMLDVDPWLVDVNVHPKKSEVKFSDSRKIYNLVFSAISETLWVNKIAVVDDLEPQEFSTKQFAGDNKSFEFSQVSSYVNPQKQQLFHQNEKKFTLNHGQSLDSSISDETFDHDVLWEYQIVWQLWNSYIVVQTNDGLHYIDQHALAERIAFEQMKKKVGKNNWWHDKSEWLKPELLLQALRVQVQKIPDLDEKIAQLQDLWFDISLLWENVVVVYSVPKVFVIYKVDLETLFNHILYLETISFDYILDKIFATKACKASIKAWQKLSYQQMVNLLEDGFKFIDGMFVCQHGRPFFVRIEKKDVDKLFDR